MNQPACYNQPRPTEHSGYWVMTRQYFCTGEYEIVDTWIPNTMSRECNVGKEFPLPECAGCEHHAKLNPTD